MIDQVIKILILEDLPNDQTLLKRQINKFAPNAIFTIANSKESFKEKINWSKYDLVLSDYNIPGYNGLEALLLVKEKMPHIPFVFVTGTLNDEEKVAQAILEGAAGYVLKDNLKHIETTLRPILEQSFKNQESIEEVQRGKIRKARLMQKLEAKVKQLPNSDHKEELVDILEEIATYQVNE